MQKGLQYHQVEQSLDQVRVSPKYQWRPLRLGSLKIGIAPQRQRFSSVLSREGHHHQQIRTNLTTQRKLLEGHANMFLTLRPMDLAWTLRLQRQHPSDDETMGLRARSTAIDSPATACNWIKMAITSNKNLRSQYHHLTTLLQKTVLMAWNLMKMPMPLAAQRRRIQ